MAIFSLGLGGLSAQQNNSVKEKATKKEQKRRARKIYSIVESGADFPGGKEEMFKFANKNITYPLTALNDSIYGSVMIQVIIEMDGSLSEIKIIKGIREDINEEAIRLIKSMPKWEPGKIKGEAVRVKRVIPIKFSLP